MGTGAMGAWQGWALLGGIFVIMFEVAGVGRHADVMAAIDHHLELLRNRRGELIESIEQLRLALLRPDTRFDRAVAKAKDMANVPIAIAAAIGYAALKSVVSSSMGGNPGSQNSVLDAAEKINDLHEGLAMGGEGALDTALPSKRAARDLPVREAELIELEAEILVALAIKDERMRWRERVVADSALWASIGALISAAVAVTAPFARG